MKEVVQKVERVLSNLKCGYKFEKKESDLVNGGVMFVSPSSTPIMFGDLMFNIGLCVYVDPEEDGTATVEYQIGKYLGAASECNDVVFNALKGHGAPSLESARKIYDGILYALDEVFEGMLHNFDREFEEALPDVYIVDRRYRPNPGEVPVRVRMVVDGHRHPEAV